MKNTVYVIVDDDGTVIKASPDRDYLEALCEDHLYKIRDCAMNELDQDGDGNEKDLF